MKKAIFLDRDGTINFDSKNYIKSLDEFKIFPYASEALEILQNMDYILIVITNQSGIGRKYFPEEELGKMHNYMVKSFREDKNIEITDIYYCPHLPEDNCDCRKPKIKNLQTAIAKYDIDVEKSWFIGDSQKDIETGNNINSKTALVLSGTRDLKVRDLNNWLIKPTIVANNLLEAAMEIRNLEQNNI